jgi:hypothetical protein
VLAVQIVGGVEIEFVRVNPGHHDGTGSVRRDPPDLLEVGIIDIALAILDDARAGMGGRRAAEEDEDGEQARQPA